VLLGAAGGVYERNAVDGNACSGIGVRGTARPLLDGNVVARNRGYGVWLQVRGMQTCTNAHTHTHTRTYVVAR
jgi:hypothetical protein